MNPFRCVTVSMLLGLFAFCARPSAQATADFTATPTEGSSPLHVEFTSTVSGMANPQFFWLFGDTVQSTEESPKHIYTTPGTYTVSLVVVDGAAFATELKPDLIVVAPAFLSPDFSASTAGGVNPVTVEFTDLSTGATPDTWAWSFGDGASSSDPNPTHTYTKPGVYDVRLVTSLGGQDASMTKQEVVTVEPAVLEPNFETSVRAGMSPLLVAFTDTSFGVEPDRWHWDFGDGATSTEQEPSHTYLVAGRYDVTLTLTFGGQVASVTKRAVWVSPSDFEPEFAADIVAGVNPVTVAFEDLTTIEGTGSASPDAWLWVFGGSNVAMTTSSETNPTVTFTAPGVYDVSLSIEFAGVTKTARKAGFVVVEPAPLEVEFTADVTKGQVPVTVQFANLTTGDEVTEWNWTFDTVVPSTEENPVVTFSKPGKHDVTLTAFIGDQKAKVRKHAYIEVTPVRLQTEFSSDRRVGEVPLTVSFEGRSAGVEPTAWSWSFRDVEGSAPALSSSEQSPAITFFHPGSYDVTCTASFEGQFEPVTVEDYIYVPPAPACFEIEHILEATFLVDDFDVNESFLVRRWKNMKRMSAYDIDTHDLISTLFIEDYGASSITHWGLDGSRAIIGATGGGSFGEAYVVDLVTGTLLTTLSPSHVNPPDDFGRRVDLEGDIALVTSGGHAYLFDISDLASPVQLSKFTQQSDDLEGFGWNAVMRGDRVFIARYADAGYLFDISDLTAPVETAVIEGGGFLNLLLTDEVAVAWLKENKVVSVYDAQTGALRGEIAHPLPELSTGFGASVAVSDDYLAIGADREWHVLNSGVVTLYDLDTLEIAGHLAPTNGSSKAHFGDGIAVLGSSMFVASPDQYSHSGSIDRFELPENTVWEDIGGGLAGELGTPTLVGRGNLCPTCTVSLAITQAPPEASVVFIVGLTNASTPFAGGVMVPSPDVRLGGFTADETGDLYLQTSVPAPMPPGTSLYIQAWARDPATGGGVAGSNAVRAEVLGDPR